MQLADVRGSLAERRVGLRNDPVHAPEHVEVVDINRTEIGLQGIEKIGQRNPLSLGLNPVDLHFELRDIGLIGANRIRHARRLCDLSLKCA